MGNKRTLSNFFKSNNGKLLLICLLFLVIIFIGSLMVSLGMGFKRRTIFLRSLYIVIGIVWVIFTIRAIAIKVNFPILWRNFIDGILNHQEDYERQITRRYQQLIIKYPLSLAEFESHCWRQDPRPTSPEIMEEALSIKEEEWIARESAAREKMGKKHHSD